MKVQITHKLDGGSLELVYEGGILRQAITRGDGNVGDDITPNAIQFNGVPTTISRKEKLSVRGEFLMSRETFNKHYKGVAANARNIGNGLAKSKTQKPGQSLKHIDFVAYGLEIQGWQFKSESDITYELYKLGFETPVTVTVDSMEGIEKVYREALEQRANFKYTCDGLVVKIDELKEQNQFDVVNGRPRGQVALKFPPAEVVAEVVRIEWTMGLSGRFCPVAHVKPVDLGGEVTLRKVSLHNLDQLMLTKVTVGAKILVERAGDVIPHLKSVVEEGKSFYRV